MSKPQYDDSKDMRFQFFQRNRRKLILEKITPQANAKGDDRKIVLHFMMPITGEKLTGLPQFIKPAYECLEKEESLVARAPLDTDFQLDGITLEFYSTEASPNSERIGMLTNKCLYDFTCEHEAEGDARLTVLRFKVRTIEKMGVYAFWCKWGQMKVWVDFTPCENAVKEGDDRQMSLVESGGKAETPEEEERPALAETA